MDVGHEQGRTKNRNGSQKPIEFGEGEWEAFEAIKLKLQESMELNTVNPDRPFVLQVDASG